MSSEPAPARTAEWAPWKDAVRVAFLALLLRGALVALFGRDVPPADDGVFYDVVARRVAQGLGYTWLWPDGVVTYAAHYPVGYAGLLGAAHVLFGPSRLVAFAVNAGLGALAVLATHRVAARAAGRRGALLAALCVCLSPTLLGYTLALMTEGAVATGWITATWCALVASEARPGSSRRRLGIVATAVVLGAAVLVRPQSLLLGPVLGYVAAGPSRRRARAAHAVVVTALAVAVCLPWTARNCARMDRCVFVSANGGWNLLIGTFPEGAGAFVPIDGARVPEACREVFAEAAKDACFGAAGRERIRERPLAWLRLVPEKLRHTFDFTASASAYLKAAGAVDERGGGTLATLEVAFRRLLVGLALFGALRSGGTAGRRFRLSLFVVGALCLLGPWAWSSHAALVGLVLTAGASSRRPGLLVAGGAIAATAFVHGVFFGAGRYSMVLEPLLATLAAAGLASRATARRGPPRDESTVETGASTGSAKKGAVVFDSVA